MAQNPKYDNDTVNLGYLNKRLGQTEESINKNNSSISQLPKNYSTPPNPPYYKDSLLCYGNKIYKCNTTKLKGEFSWNDWTIVATDDTTISDFINNTYELDKLEIQEQIDGKVQTYYQENDPSKEWTTELDKGRHIGDYWYNTTNDTQWRYNRIINGSTITYGWGQVNIPKAVFDTIDSKKSIYTEKPTSYQKDDLWIIEESLSDEDLPVGTEENPIAKGDWVFSIANSDTYNKEHWVKRDEDISMTYIKQHYYTIGEIDSSFEEIERNTDSKITKAKDEISLSVEQTYTTKEEHEATIYDFDEKIGTINQTITNHKETISDLSIEVGEITSTVESIEETTKNLEVNIDDVSADFEDFKDNEYIQSIDNLQKQIDGAIQFWNGAEIPTLENYPSNEWTTENDKINHQADIYTVVQDVEGEMKQGKSYRFDKIDGVWQWIELTDNELSAVQAIAQEALEKAKTNTTEISAVKTNVSELKQTDEQIKASVESINKQIIPTTGMTGSDIYIENALDSPLIDLEIEGKSEQKTRDGKNLITSIVAGSTSTSVSNGTITFDFTQNIDSYVRVYFPKEVGKTYTFVFDGAGLQDGERVRFYLDNDSSVNYLFKNGKNVWVEYADADNGSFVIDDMSRAEISSIITMSNVMILEGEYTEDTIPSYQEPGESPSPDYPSEIKNVGYENLFDFNKVTGLKNLTNENGTFTQIQADTRENLYWAIRSYNDSTHIEKLVQETYNDIGRHSMIFTKTSDYNRIRIGLETLSVQTIFYYDVSEFENGKTYKFTFTITNNVQGTISFNDIVISEDIEEHNYIPYGKYGIEIKVTGRNKIPFKKQAFTMGGVELYTEEGSLYLNGDSTSEVSSLHSTYGKRFNFQLEAGDYVFSHKVDVVAVYLYDEYDNRIALLSKSVDKITFTLNKKTNLYLGFYLYQNSFTNVNTEIMISKENGTYEPYKERVTTIVLNQPLRSSPNGNDVKDIMYIKNNKLYVDRKIGEFTLDGSDDEIYDIGNTNYNVNTIYFGYKGLHNVGKINGKTQSNLLANKKIWNVDQEGIAYEGSTGNISFRFRINKSRLSTEDIVGLRSYLSINNLKAQYELLEPYTEEIGEIEMPNTFEGVNNIITTDELEPIINLTYATNTIIANYVEQHIAELKISDNEIRSQVSSVDSFATSLGSSIDGKLQDISKTFNNYVPSSDFVTLEKSVNQLQTDTYTKTEINTKLTDGSVTKVSTISGTFDENGMHYEKTNAPTSSTINEKGVEVDSTTTGEELLFAGYDEELNQTIVRTENLTVRKYFIVGDNSRIENYGNGGGIFII